MENMKCKFCGSSYVDLRKTENGERGKERAKRLLEDMLNDHS